MPRKTNGSCYHHHAKRFVHTHDEELAPCDKRGEDRVKIPTGIGYDGISGYVDKGRSDKLRLMERATKYEPQYDHAQYRHHHSEPRRKGKDGREQLRNTRMTRRETRNLPDQRGLLFGGRNKPEHEDWSRDERKLADNANAINPRRENRHYNTDDAHREEAQYAKGES
jgi:hypothetical protein